MNTLVQYQFKPGQSGNPGGRIADPALRRLQKQIRAKRPLLLKTLEDCLNAKSRRVRIEALKLAFLYGFGKPAEVVPEPEESEFLRRRVDAGEDESPAQARPHVIVIKQVNGQETQHTLGELSSEELVQMVRALPGDTSGEN